jgi:hypothetical protein
MALTQSQLLAAVADRAEITKADAKRVLDALEAVAWERAEGSDRWARAAHRQGQAGAEEAPRPQPRHRRGDHDRGQAGQR